MRSDALLTLGLALVCIVAVGTASSTLDSTVSTEPDDVIDVNHREVPIGKDRVSSLREDLDDPQRTADPDGSSSGSDDGTGGQDSESDDPRSTSDELVSGESSDGGPGDGVQRAGGEDGNGAYGNERGLLEMLLGLLIAIVPYLVGAVMLTLAVVLLRRYRGQLLTLLADDDGEPPGGSGEPTDVEWPGEPAGDPVTRAWVRMVSAAGVEDPWTKTPRECAREAKGRGLDAEAVATVTRTYEQVRYTDAEVTEDLERRAREAVDSFGPGVSL